MSSSTSNAVKSDAETCYRSFVDSLRKSAPTRTLYEQALGYFMADASKKDKKDYCVEVEPSTFECSDDSKKACQEFTGLKCLKRPDAGGE